MALKLFKKIFGSRNDRLIKQYTKKVQQINVLEEALPQLSDDALKAKTPVFKQQLAEGTITLDQLLPEAFAVVREASKRVMGMRHYDTQLVGGMVLHDGNIARCARVKGKHWLRLYPPT